MNSSKIFVLDPSCHAPSRPLPPATRKPPPGSLASLSPNTPGARWAGHSLRQSSVQACGARGLESRPHSLFQSSSGARLGCSWPWRAPQSSARTGIRGIRAPDIGVWSGVPRCSPAKWQLGLEAPPLLLAGDLGGGSGSPAGAVPWVPSGRGILVFPQELWAPFFRAGSARAPHTL